jgi:GNAT superfamily N-acetyltransferase
MPELNNLQFEHAEYEGSHIVVAKTGPRQVGQMTWRGSTSPAAQALEPGEIQRIDVDKKYRRKGVASGMLEHARTVDPGVKHSNHLSGPGKKWSEARP